MRLTRSVGVSILLIVATLFWTAFGLGVWVNRQALDTENWVNTSDQLLENDDIREALGLFIVDRLFESADVQQRLEEALPPQLDRLAGPAAAGLKQVAGRNAPRVLGSDAALNAWRKANEVAHSTTADASSKARLANGGVTLDLQELFDRGGRRAPGCRPARPTGFRPRSPRSWSSSPTSSRT